jgi:phenylacetic acid degradation operon negative regulatory protein
MSGRYTQSVSAARTTPLDEMEYVQRSITGGDGQHPQHLLLTLLGDYWLADTGIVPSGALVDLLAEFGISTPGARAALSRLSRRGLLQSTKSGRRTYYELSSRARTLLSNGLDRIVRFGAEPAPWDGLWTWVAFSVPEDQRSMRHQLRSRLRWLGFAPLYDGLWVSARQLGTEVDAILDEVGVGSATVLVGRDLGSGTRYGRPIDAWDLDGVRELYAAFIAQMTPIQQRLHAGGIAPSEALVARTHVMDEWRAMPNIDPELPTELLPPAWPRDAARSLFRNVYDGLGESATVRVRQIVAAHAPDLVDRISVHTTGA